MACLALLTFFSAIKQWVPVITKSVNFLSYFTKTASVRASITFNADFTPIKYLT